jgi:iron complex transport system substrate-binding protein
MKNMPRIAAVMALSVIITAMAASASDYVLGIYGNANMDNTIDQRDIAYVKEVISGAKPATNLTDANYDGKIDQMDVSQIEQMINGTETEVTIIQYLRTPPNVVEEPVTVSMPINKVVATAQYAAEAVVALGAKEKLVGVTEYAKEKELGRLMEGVPSTGGEEWDMETIAKLKPDLVIDGAWMDCAYEDKLKEAEIPLIQADYNHRKKYASEISVLGWLLGNIERANNLIDFEKEHFALIQDRVKDLPEEKKARVYFEWGSTPNEYKGVGQGNSLFDAVVDCGGENVFTDVNKSTFDVDPEMLVARNPDVIFKSIIDRFCSSGYGVTNTTELEAWRSQILSRPEIANTDAVKDKRVYLINMYAGSIHPSIYRLYLAKCLYPELFRDIDPVVIQAEWTEKFLGTDFTGVYAYPLPE